MSSNLAPEFYRGHRLSVIPEAPESPVVGHPRIEDEETTDIEDEAQSGIDDSETTDIEDDVQSGIEYNDKTLPKIAWARPFDAVPSANKCSMWKLHFSCEDCMSPAPDNCCLHHRWFDDLPVYGIWQCSGARADHFKRIAYLNHLLSQSRLEGTGYEDQMPKLLPDYMDSLNSPQTFEHRTIDETSRYSSSFVEWPEPFLNRSGLAMRHCARCHDVPSPFKNGEIPWLHMDLQGCRYEGDKRSAMRKAGSSADVFARDNRVAQLREIFWNFQIDRVVGDGGRDIVAKERGYHWLHLNLFQEEVLKHASIMHGMVKPWRRCASMKDGHEGCHAFNKDWYNGDKWFVPGVPEPPLAPARPAEQAKKVEQSKRESGVILVAYWPEEGERS